MQRNHMQKRFHKQAQKSDKKNNPPPPSSSSSSPSQFVELVRRELLGNRYCSKTINDEYCIDIHYTVTEIENKVLSVIIRKKDLYVIAFGDGVTYTFKDEFKCSKPLVMKEDYSSMGGLKGRDIGYDPLRKAVIYLIGKISIEQKNTINWKPFMITIIVMTCEAARFNWILDTCSTLMLEKASSKIEPWMQKLINNWLKLSDQARMYPHDGITEIQCTDNEEHIKTTRDYDTLVVSPKLCRKWMGVLAHPKQ